MTLSGLYLGLSGGGRSLSSSHGFHSDLATCPHGAGCCLCAGDAPRVSTGPHFRIPLINRCWIKRSSGTDRFGVWNRRQHHFSSK